MTLPFILMAIVSVLLMAWYFLARTTDYNTVTTSQIVETEGFKAILLEVEKWIAVAASIGFLAFVPFDQIGSIIDFVQLNTDAAVKAASTLVTIGMALWAQLRQISFKAKTGVEASGMGAKSVTKKIYI